MRENGRECKLGRAAPSGGVAFVLRAGAGGVIDDNAARIAYKRGLLIMRLEGGVEFHPAVADGKFRLKEY